MEGSLTRVLLLERSALARRSVAVWRQLGVETVLAFATEDAEQPWLDDADYAVYHGGSVGERPSFERIVGAAMDAGCDAIDPGPLSDDLDLLDLAVRANLAVIGADPTISARYADPDWTTARAAELGVPAAPIGPWPEPESLRRRMDVWVLVDRQGGQVTIGPVECTVGLGPDAPWLLEHGQVWGTAGRKALTEASARLVRQVGSPGLLRVRWGWHDETTWALRGISSAVGPGWPLLDAVHGFDGVWARISAWLGGSGVTATLDPQRHGVLGRVVAAEDGAIDALVLPESAVANAEEGSEVRAGETIALVLATAPTRQAALVRLAAELEEVGVHGPRTGLEALRAVAGNRALWDGRLDLHAAERLLRA